MKLSVRLFVHGCRDSDCGMQRSLNLGSVIQGPIKKGFIQTYSYSGFVFLFQRYVGLRGFRATWVAVML